MLKLSSPLLLISDGSHELTAFVENLRSKRFALEFAADLEEGRRLFKELLPEILLLSFGSPMLAGQYHQHLLNATKAKKAAFSQVIVLCTNAEAHLAAKLALEYKTIDYFPFKPILDPNRLYVGIQHALDRRSNLLQIDALNQRLQTTEKVMKETMENNAKFSEQSTRSKETLIEGIEGKLVEFENRMTASELNDAVQVVNAGKLKAHFDRFKKNEIRPNFETFSKELNHSQEAFLKKLTEGANSPKTLTVVLAIDDDPKGLSLIKAMLEPAGYTVLCASNTQQAVAIATRKQPDIILMDVMMPHVNGIELTRRFRENPQLSGTPIIMVTAYGSDEIVRLSADVGASDFINKPVRLPVLLEKIRQFCPS